MCDFIKYVPNVRSKKLRICKLKKKKTPENQLYSFPNMLSLDDLSNRFCNISTYFQILINNLTFSYAKVQCSLISKLHCFLWLRIARDSESHWGHGQFTIPPSYSPTLPPPLTVLDIQGGKKAGMQKGVCVTSDYNLTPVSLCGRCPDVCSFSHGALLWVPPSPTLPGPPTSPFLLTRKISLIDHV